MGYLDAKFDTHHAAAAVRPGDADRDRDAARAVCRSRRNSRVTWVCRTPSTLASNWSLTPRVDLSYTDEQFFDAGNSPEIAQNEAITLLSASVTLASDDDKWRVRAGRQQSHRRAVSGGRHFVADYRVGLLGDHLCASAQREPEHHPQLLKASRRRRPASWPRRDRGSRRRLADLNCRSQEAVRKSPPNENRWIPSNKRGWRRFSCARSRISASGRGPSAASTSRPVVMSAAGATRRLRSDGQARSACRVPWDPRAPRPGEPRRPRPA